MPNEVYSDLYFLQRDNAKRKPYTGNRFVRFDEKGEVERPQRTHIFQFQSHNAQGSPCCTLTEAKDGEI